MSEPSTPAGAPADIEITPEMIEAGVEALVRAVPTGDLPTSFDFQLEIVCSVYGAMADSRRRHAMLKHIDRLALALNDGRALSANWHLPDQSQPSPALLSPEKIQERTLDQQPLLPVQSDD